MTSFNYIAFGRLRINWTLWRSRRGMNIRDTRCIVLRISSSTSEFAFQLDLCVRCIRSYQWASFHLFAYFLPSGALLLQVRGGVVLYRRAAVANQLKSKWVINNKGCFVCCTADDALVVQSRGHPLTDCDSASAWYMQGWRLFRWVDNDNPGCNKGLFTSITPYLSSWEWSGNTPTGIS